jgi:hypothetical protein
MFVVEIFLDVERLHCDGSIDITAKTLNLTTPVLPGGKDRKPAIKRYKSQRSDLSDFHLI